MLLAIRSSPFASLLLLLFTSSQLLDFGEGSHLFCLSVCSLSVIFSSLVAQSTIRMLIAPKFISLAQTFLLNSISIIPPNACQHLHLDVSYTSQT